MSKDQKQTEQAVSGAMTDDVERTLRDLRNLLSRDQDDKAALSWDGKNVYGDSDSIDAVKAALHEAGNVPQLKEMIRKLQSALSQVRGKEQEPAAELVRYSYAGGTKDGWDIRVFDKSLPNGTKFYAAAPQVAQEEGARGQHYDDYAVDCFAELMKEKLRYSREVKGRGGWNDPQQCSAEYLNQLLLEHVEKGDPVDVANLCMMLRHYNAKITAAPQSDAQPSSEKDVIEAAKNLVKVKGRYHSEQAYNQLSDAVTNLAKEQGR